MMHCTVPGSPDEVPILCCYLSLITRDDQRVLVLDFIAALLATVSIISVLTLPILAVAELARSIGVPELGVGVEVSTVLLLARSGRAARAVFRVWSSAYALHLRLLSMLDANVLAAYRVAKRIAGYYMMEANVFGILHLCRNVLEKSPYLCCGECSTVTSLHSPLQQ